jgi:hypothetical protein
LKRAIPEGSLILKRCERGELYRQWHVEARTLTVASFAIDACAALCTVSTGRPIRRETGRAPHLPQRICHSKYHIEHAVDDECQESGVHPHPAVSISRNLPPGGAARSNTLTFKPLAPVPKRPPSQPPSRP